MSSCVFPQPHTRPSRSEKQKQSGADGKINIGRNRKTKTSEISLYCTYLHFCISEVAPTILSSFLLSGQLLSPHRRGNSNVSKKQTRTKITCSFVLASTIFLRALACDRRSLLEQKRVNFWVPLNTESLACAMHFVWKKFSTGSGDFAYWLSKSMKCVLKGDIDLKPGLKRTHAVKHVLKANAFSICKWDFWLVVRG